MSHPTHYPAGVPCWVTGLQADTDAALDFYGPLFGWSFEAGPPREGGGMPGSLAMLDGHEVAAVAPVPPGVAPTWMTEVSVEDVRATAERVREAGGMLLAEPMELEAGRLVVFADPTGAGLSAWEAGARKGAQVVNEPGAWSMSVLHTPAPDAAVAFYRAVFGWEPEAYGPMTMFRLPGYVGGKPEQPVPRDVVAAMAPAAAGESAHWAVDFWVHDAEAAAAHAERSGGAVLAPVHDAPPFRQAVLQDPQGATFSVSQLVAG